MKLSPYVTSFQPQDKLLRNVLVLVWATFGTSPKKDLGIGGLSGVPEGTVGEGGQWVKEGEGRHKMVSQRAGRHCGQWTQSG